jgi:hypothetical protein
MPSIHIRFDNRNAVHPINLILNYAYADSDGSSKFIFSLMESEGRR